jgi:hypothetical protein
MRLTFTKGCLIFGVQLVCEVRGPYMLLPGSEVNVFTDDMQKVGAEFLEAPLSTHT